KQRRVSPQDSCWSAADHFDGTLSVQMAPHSGNVPHPPLVDGPADKQMRSLDVIGRLPRPRGRSDPAGREYGIWFIGGDERSGPLGKYTRRFPFVHGDQRDWLLAKGFITDHAVQCEVVQYSRLGIPHLNSLLAFPIHKPILIGPG